VYSAPVVTWAQYQAALHAFELAAERLLHAGVPIIPVKGIALARWLYEDVGERAFVDVDLLLPRRDWGDARRALLPLGSPLYDSWELGELTFDIAGMHVELHGEIGRLDLTEMSVDDVLRRSTIDNNTFRFPVHRLDEIDHFLLVVSNAVKDGWVFAQPHLPSDLERFLPRVDRSELLARATEAGMYTGLYCTAEWMAYGHDSARWSAFLATLAEPQRQWYVRASRSFRRARRPVWAAAAALGFASNDLATSRMRAVRRLLRRNAVKLLGRTPP
jgi:hypothetical protein